MNSRPLASSFQLLTTQTYSLILLSHYPGCQRLFFSRDWEGDPCYVFLLGADYLSLNLVKEITSGTQGIVARGGKNSVSTLFVCILFIDI